MLLTKNAPLDSHLVKIWGYILMVVGMPTKEFLKAI